MKSGCVSTISFRGLARILNLSRARAHPTRLHRFHNPALADPQHLLNKFLACRLMPLPQVATLLAACALHSAYTRAGGPPCISTVKGLG